MSMMTRTLISTTSSADNDDDNDQNVGSRPQHDNKNNVRRVARVGAVRDHKLDVRCVGSVTMF